MHSHISLSSRRFGYKTKNPFDVQINQSRIISIFQNIAQNYEYPFTKISQQGTSIKVPAKRLPHLLQEVSAKSPLPAFLTQGRIRNPLLHREAPA
jgi:hypothetical protein